MPIAWKPIEDLSRLDRSASVQLLGEQMQRWEKVCGLLEDRELDRGHLDIWLRERNRRFAIGTGEVEALYTLKRGFAEQLITEGLDGVESSHTFENVNRETLRGLLADQEETLEAIFDMVKDGEPLSHYTIRGLHAKVTKHQDHAIGIDRFGKHTRIPLLKGQYKIRPNNPRRADGEIHNYCPPEQTQAEMDRLLSMHRKHCALNEDMLSEAAWLHHRFVQIHPFQDGNGRMARLLMAYIFVKASGFPPVVTPTNRDAYIDSLERADEGDLQPFADFLAVESAISATHANVVGENILRGVNHYRHSNRGITIDGRYFPPGTPEADCMDLPFVPDAKEQETCQNRDENTNEDRGMDR